MEQCKTLPVQYLIQSIYPDLYPVHALNDKVGKMCCICIYAIWNGKSLYRILTDICCTCDYMLYLIHSMLHH